MGWPRSRPLPGPEAHSFQKLKQLTCSAERTWSLRHLSMSPAGRGEPVPRSGQGPVVPQPSEPGGLQRPARLRPAPWARRDSQRWAGQLEPLPFPRPPLCSLVFRASTWGTRVQGWEVAEEMRPQRCEWRREPERQDTTGHTQAVCFLTAENSHSRTPAVTEGPREPVGK